MRRRLRSALALLAFGAGCSTSPAALGDQIASSSAAPQSPPGVIAASPRAPARDAKSQTADRPPDTPAASPTASAPPVAPRAPRASPTAPALPEAPVAADDPAGLAAQLATAQATLHNPRSPADAASAGHLQQVAIQRLATSSEWLDAVLAALPADVHPGVRANLGASLEFRSLQGDPPTTLPSWRIVAPPPVEVLRATYAEAEAASGVPWAYLAAIHLVETRMSRIAGDSVAGAQGPMQFIPETWARFGQGDVRDTRQAILAAGRYLAASGAPGDIDRALYAYNNSQRYVRAVRAYAERMLADERAFLGYYHWQVYYAQPGGAVWLREGYDGAGP